MSPVFDTSAEAELLKGMRLARTAIGRGDLIVMPTDTVYGIAADAFNKAAVGKLLEAKGRTRAVPPPVLVPGIPTLDALAATVPQPVRDLVKQFWPGALTVILPAQPSLDWDLGDTGGTVAVRMPAHPIALELMSETGPLAVSSANRHGQTPATTAAQADDVLGDAVAVVLDAGPSGDVPSTIVDATALVDGSGNLRIVRAGALSREQLADVVGDDLIEG